MVSISCALEDALDLPRERQHLLDDLAALHHREIPKAGQLEGEEQERDHLAGERLCRSDTDFRTGVDVDAAVALARDCRADDIHDSIGERAARLGFRKSVVEGQSVDQV